MRCPYCGAILPAIKGEFVRCRVCAKRFMADEFFDKETPDEGEENSWQEEDSELTDSEIDEDVSETDFSISQYQKWEVFRICLTSGISGTHRFHVGLTKSGTLYAFTGGLFLIGWIRDLIVIASGKFKDSSGKYIQ